MYGGIEDNANNRIVPTPDVWMLSVGQSKFTTILGALDLNFKLDLPLTESSLKMFIIWNLSIWPAFARLSDKILSPDCNFDRIKLKSQIAARFKSFYLKMAQNQILMLILFYLCNYRGLLMGKESA